jgi:phosphoesterase RecJ-like protein
MYKQLGIGFNKDIATYIYIAMLTDTGSFNYSNTNGQTHNIVAELLSFGIEPYDISVKVYASKRLCDIRLLGMVLETLDVEFKGTLAYMICTKEMIDKSGSDISATENFVNYAREVKTAKVGLFIRQNTDDTNIYKVSIRTKDDISATNIANTFGGGGHIHAAGCTIKGGLEEVKKTLFKAVEKELKKK